MTETSCLKFEDFLPPSRPLLIVLSGPSAAGKDAVLTEMKKKGLPLEYVVTVTTRHQRAGEKDGIDYHFVSAEEFRRMVDGGEFLEWAGVYGNNYGVPRQAVKGALDEGRDVLIKVDVKGAATVRRLVPQAVLVFLVPPSFEELEQRLRERKIEAGYDLRFKAVMEELKQISIFDYVVTNRRGEIERAILDIESIIRAEKCRVISREYHL